MAVEIHKLNYPFTYGNFYKAALDIAQFFSASTHFDIIDSWSPGAGRYKGDPITGGKWIDTGDTGESSWFVVECKTSIHSGLGTTLPKWQAKFQWHDWNYYYDVSDPSGTIYANSYWRRAWRSRFCPWGGWDFADVTPDFRPQGKPYPASSENGGWAMNHGGSGNDTRGYIVIDTGGFLSFHRRNQGAYDLMGLGCYMGDVLPAIAGVWPNPRMHMPMGDFSVVSLVGVGNNVVLAEESYTNSYGRLDMPDESDDGTWFSGAYRVPTGWLILANGLAVPNGQSPNLEMDTFPFMPIPTSRRGVTGTIPMIRKGYGVGHTLVANKQWVSCGYGYCVFLKWDGATSLY
jgi:hypothetical protein